MSQKLSRRQFIKTASVGSIFTSQSYIAFSQEKNPSTLTIDPTPRFDLSPHLYMQFMEPLGTTDGSVSAAWDYKKDQWRRDVIETTQALSPSMIRWGGIFSDYYRWKEGVGPRDQREPMLNLLWGGVEPNQVGTQEFVSFCHQVNASPLICVNFESDGRKKYMKIKGDRRWGDAQEAAEWVDYCNNPDNSLRRQHGVKNPYHVPFWQIGNETSYSDEGFDKPTAIKKTIEFARAMKNVDPSIKLIGWGEGGWAPDMIDEAGDYLDYLAFHHMFNPETEAEELRFNNFRKDFDRTWDVLMNSYKQHESKIRRYYDQVSESNMPLALTECHYTIPGRNRCEVLSTWAAGVSYARMLNVHERYGDKLKIATAADFCGTRWQVNAIMIPVPGGNAFMMPVARVMSLYRQHSGKNFLNLIHAPDGLDVTASRTGNQIYLHVVNTNMNQSVPADFSVQGETIQSGKVFEISTDPQFEVMRNDPEQIAPKEKQLPLDSKWQFPAASVSAVVLEV